MSCFVASEQISIVCHLAGKGHELTEPSFLLPADFEWKKVSANGFIFDVITAGQSDGSAVIFLHGFPEFADAWIEIMKPIAAGGFRCIAIQQRGYSDGARPKQVGDYKVDKLVGDVLAIADALGAKRFHLVAHDWGGIVAWLLAARHPERLATLSVLSTPHVDAFMEAIKVDPEQKKKSWYVGLFRFPFHLAEFLILRNDAKLLKSCYRGQLSDEQLTRNVFRFSKPGVLTAALNWYRALDKSVNVGIIRDTPVLFIWGSADQALGRTAATKTADFVSSKYQFEPLEGLSHWLLEQAPEQCAELCLRHFSSDESILKSG